MVSSQELVSGGESGGRWAKGRCGRCPLKWPVVDLTGGQGLLAQVEGRTTAAGLDWLTARPAAWLAQVTAVAIDMCTVFKAAVAQILPHATLVVDHFYPV